MFLKFNKASRHSQLYIDHDRLLCFQEDLPTYAFYYFYLFRNDVPVPVLLVQRPSSILSIVLSDIYRSVDIYLLFVYLPQYIGLLFLLEQEQEGQ
jgi:hypothetical protein